MDQSRINVSHVLQDIEFGHSWPGKTKTLQGIKRIADQLGGVYRYYMSVVPTQYQSISGAPPVVCCCVSGSPTYA